MMVIIAQNRIGFLLFNKRTSGMQSKGVVQNVFLYFYMWVKWGKRDLKFHLNILHVCIKMESPIRWFCLEFIYCLSIHPSIFIQLRLHS